jgi:hypothetical protein
MEGYRPGMGTVLTILNEAGATRHQRRATPAQIQQAVELYTQGWSLKRLGEHFGFEDTNHLVVAEEGWGADEEAMGGGVAKSEWNPSIY